MYRDPAKCKYDSSGVYVGWVKYGCPWRWARGIQVFCCDNLYYGFPFLTFFFNPVCLDLLSVEMLLTLF